MCFIVRGEKPQTLVYAPDSVSAVLAGRGVGYVIRWARRRNKGTREPRPQDAPVSSRDRLYVKE